eukprot:Skav214665  [mRNA]  locus=scaffold923:195935:200644:+ [translate_table: standard]
MPSMFCYLAQAATSYTTTWRAAGTESCSRDSAAMLGWSFRKSHKPIYRTWAMALHGIATLLMIGAVTSYSIFAVSAMDAIGTLVGTGREQGLEPCFAVVLSGNPNGGGGIVGVIEASQSVGISPGYFLVGVPVAEVWLGILLQLVAFGMHCCMRLSNEESEDDRIYKVSCPLAPPPPRARQEMLKEQQKYGAMEERAWESARDERRR